MPLRFIQDKLLTRRPERLLLSELAPILKYGSGPSHDFLAKILRVLCNTQFYFPVSSLLVLKSY
jgi:hypothetical protein